MSSLPTSEYKRNFSWTFNNGYSRSSLPVNYKTSNVIYRTDLVDFIDAYSKIDHKAAAKQFMKLNPYLYGNGTPHETKSEYELSQSIYKDTFRKHATYPSMVDYVQIANNVADGHFPDSVKYFYDPGEFQKNNNSGKKTSDLRAVDIPFPKSTNKVLKEDVDNYNMIPKESMNPSLPPKITDLGAFCYRNDLSPECMPKEDSLEEYVREASKKITSIVRRDEYVRKAAKVPIRKPKRYIDLPVY